MTLKTLCNALAMTLALAATPALVMANADSGKAKGAAKAPAAPKKASKLGDGEDPFDVKGPRSASGAKGAQASTAKGGKPTNNLGVVDDPFGVKGRAVK